MMRATPKIWLSAAFALGVSALGACNAVLGIDDAELDQAATGTGGTAGTGAPSGGSGGSATGGTSPSTSVKAETTCNTADAACRTCVDTCHPSAVEACLLDGECRYALISYLSCLESDCSDTTGDCLERLTVSDAGRGIALCLSDTCEDACAGSGVVTVCDVYCSCMPDTCSSVVADTPRDACLATCGNVVTTLGVATSVCRLDHCQIANVDPNSHCQHAVGEAGDPCSTIGNPPTNCERTRKGFPCKQNSDCCSNNCIGQLSCG